MNSSWCRLLHEWFKSRYEYFKGQQWRYKDAQQTFVFNMSLFSLMTITIGWLSDYQCVVVKWNHTWTGQKHCDNASTVTAVAICVALIFNWMFSTLQPVVYYAYFELCICCLILFYLITRSVSVRDSCPVSSCVWYWRCFLTKHLRIIIIIIHKRSLLLFRIYFHDAANSCTFSRLIVFVWTANMIKCI